MGYTWAPEEIGDIDASLKVWGQLAEIILLEYYLKHVGRSMVFPHSDKDFVDFTSGWANQTLYVAFIGKNNPKLSISELLSFRRPGLLKVPDICTHDYPARTEYYECKPNSYSGKRDGDQKLAEIDALNASFNLPYKPGSIWSPTIDHVVVQDVFSGQPYTVTVQFRKLKKGLIVWNMDYSSVLLIPLEEYPEYLKQLLSHATRIAKDMIKKRLTKMLNVGTVTAQLSKSADQPLLKKSVGRGGANIRPEVMVAQILCNIARPATPVPLKIDGFVGPKTEAAIFEVQRSFLSRTDGLIEPKGPTLAHLLSKWGERIDLKLQVPMTALSAIQMREANRFNASV